MTSHSRQHVELSVIFAQDVGLELTTENQESLLAYTVLGFENDFAFVVAGFVRVVVVVAAIVAVAVN